MQSYDYFMWGLNDLARRQVSKGALKQSSCCTAAFPPPPPPPHSPPPPPLASLQQLELLNCSPNP